MLPYLTSFLEFFVGTILIKIILAHWLADQTMWVTKKMLSGSERKLAIWTHYQQRAANGGHQPKNVIDCRDGKCALF